MTHTVRVSIRARAAACALGNDVQHCIASMRDAAPAPIHLDDAALGYEARYYRIDDGSPIFAPERMDRLLLQVVRTALDEASLTAAEVRSLPIFLGSTCFSIGVCEATYAADLAANRSTARPMPHCGYQTLITPLQQALGCRGDTYAYNTACSASANALLAATTMIQAGWYPHALVIGAELANHTSLAGFAALQLSADALRPFDRDREGLVLGEGIGAVVLSSEPTAEGTLRLVGGANHCDTSSITTADPGGQAIATVIRQALARTGVEPSTLRGIKAHGTGTPSGDCAEANGIGKALNQELPICAMKPWLGHTLGACGVVELALLAALLEQHWLPPTPGFRTADPALGVTPLRAPQPASPGYYLLNHFGFGGNNTVLVVEQPT